MLEKGGQGLLKRHDAAQPDAEAGKDGHDVTDKSVQGQRDIAVHKRPNPVQDKVQSGCRRKAACRRQWQGQAERGIETPGNRKIKDQAHKRHNKVRTYSEGVALHTGPPPNIQPVFALRKS